MPMPPIEFHVAMFRGDWDQARSQYVLLWMMEALCRIDQSLIAQSKTMTKKGMIRKDEMIPLLYRSGVHYEREPPGQEHWLDIVHVLQSNPGSGHSQGEFPGPSVDCLPLSTLVMTDDYKFKPMGSLVPGDVIMGEGKWTKVVEQVVTGEKPILEFELNNGSILRCSETHRLFYADGSEVRAKDVKVGEMLLTPREPIPTSDVWNDEELNPVDFAWLLGVYIADGWCQPYNFNISGRDPRSDGQPRAKRDKTDQKKRVEEMMVKAGINTSWKEKSIAVHGKRLASLMASCGSHAPEKHLPSMKMSLEQIRAVIEGLKADSGTASSGTVTHGTTSPMLALQLRALYRMLGQSVHIRRWDDHGGLGKHPIYRVTVRRPLDELAGGRGEYHPSARVRSITLAEEELCCDIETDSGKFWLPESDLIVHNCEDLSCYRVAELRDLEFYLQGKGKDGKPMVADPNFVKSYAGSGWKKVKGGMKARPFAKWRKGPSGAFHYHALVLLPDGRIEDPSLILGMGKEAVFAEQDVAQRLKRKELDPKIQYADPPDVMVVDPESPTGYNDRRTEKAGQIGLPGKDIIVPKKSAQSGIETHPRDPRVRWKPWQTRLGQAPGGSSQVPGGAQAPGGAGAPAPATSQLTSTDITDIEQRLKGVETTIYPKKEPYLLGLGKRSLKSEVFRILHEISKQI